MHQRLMIMIEMRLICSNTFATLQNLNQFLYLAEIIEESHELLAVGPHAERRKYSNHAPRTAVSLNSHLSLSGRHARARLWETW